MRRRWFESKAEAAHWEIASTVAVQPLDEGAVVPSGVAPGDQLVGVALAQRHPSGWFLAARHRRGLAAADVDQFRHFAAVRFYLLLTQGPRPDLWQQGETEGRFTSPLALAEADAEVPDSVPAAWSGIA